MAKLWSGRLGSRPLLLLAFSAAQVFGSRLAAQVAGLMVTVLVARQLGPAPFGLYAFAATAALVLAQFPGAGLDLSAVRLSAAARADDPPRARGLLLMAGAAKTAMMLVLALLLWWAGATGTLLAALPAELVAPLHFAAATTVALALTDFAIAALQAHERFDQLLISSLIVAGLRFAPVAALAWLGRLDLAASLWLLVGTSAVGALVSVLMAWRVWRGAWHIPAGTARELLRYSGWMTAATLLGVLTANLDALLLARLAGPEALGVYSSAKSLALPLGLLGVALSAVLLPRLSRLSAAQASSYAWGITLHLAPLLALLGLGTVLAAPLLVELLFGARFAAGTTIFQLLAAALLFQIATWPAVTVLMVLNRPALIAAVSLGMLIFVGVGYWLLIPRFGGSGAGAIYLAGCVLCLPVYVALAAWVARQEVATPPPPIPPLAERI